jgi:hypothetical protein
MGDRKHNYFVHSEYYLILEICALSVTGFNLVRFWNRSNFSACIEADIFQTITVEKMWINIDL